MKTLSVVGITMCLTLGAFSLMADTGAGAMNIVPVIVGETPPDKPEDDNKPGGDNPPAKPGEGEDEGEGGGSEGGGEGGGGVVPGGGGSDDSVVLTGKYQLDGGTDTLDGGTSGATLESTTADQNVILAQSNATLTVSNYTLNKSGDTSSEDNSNFFALNAVVAAKTAAKICLDNIKLYSNADGANCLFASGSNSTIYAYNCTLSSTNDSSRGLDATYEGTVIASKMRIKTKGDHCASLATDRGNGYISVTGSTLETAGQGSALIYSTGIIEANSVTGTASGAQIAGIEGLSTIRIKNSVLSGSEHQASEPVANGVIIYQSMSGDSTEGVATFEVSDSTLTSAITNKGAMFYITNSKADIRVKNTVLDFDSDKNYLVNAAGNDGDNGWGSAGSNGAEVIFTAIDQTMAGRIAVDGISALDLYLTNSTYTGTFVQDTTNSGDGDVNVYISADSSWVVTANCTLQDLTVASGATIKDGNGKTVSIVEGEETVVSGDSALKVTVSNYTLGNVVITNSITAFKIDRTNFESMYGTSSDPITPGVVSEPYDDAQSATNAAVAINENKDSRIAVPTGVDVDLKDSYLSMVTATVTSDNCVVIDLTSAAQSNEQVVVEAAVTSETAVVALTSTNASAKATISATTPGLYYWIEGGTDVDAITEFGTSVLSTNGGPVELSKPVLDATKGRAFFQISAGVSAPAQ